MKTSPQWTGILGWGWPMSGPRFVKKLLQFENCGITLQVPLPPLMPQRIAWQLCSCGRLRLILYGFIVFRDQSHEKMSACTAPRSSRSWKVRCGGMYVHYRIRRVKSYLCWVVAGQIIQQLYASLQCPISGFCCSIAMEPRAMRTVMSMARA
jgi:hypothetical protein